MEAWFGFSFLDGSQVNVGFAAYSNEKIILRFSLSMVFKPILARVCDLRAGGTAIGIGIGISLQL
jgi:hypothetical protein